MCVTGVLLARRSTLMIYLCSVCTSAVCSVRFITVSYSSVLFAVCLSEAYISHRVSLCFCRPLTEFCMLTFCATVCCLWPLHETAVVHCRH